MSIIAGIPDNSRVRYPVVRFESDPLDGLSQYNFGITTNQLVTLAENLQPQNVYLVERLSFFANVPEGDWLEGLSVPDNFPRVFFTVTDIRKSLIGGSSIYAEPFRCANYVSNSESLIYFRTHQKDAILNGSMTGRVQQSAGMVGLATLLAQMNYTVYEIIDQRWIKEFEQGKIFKF